MSPLHAPGATIAHPGFVNTACKEEAAIKVLKFPCRIRSNARVMGVQLARYLDGLVSGIPCSCGVHGGLHLHWSCQRGKMQESVFVYICLLLSPLYFTLCTCLCLCLKWMTSLHQYGTLVFKAQNTELWDGCRWVSLGAEAPSDVLLRVRGIVWHLQLPLTEEWVASWQIREKKQHGYVHIQTFCMWIAD